MAVVVGFLRNSSDSSKIQKIRKVLVLGNISRQGTQAKPDLNEGLAAHGRTAPQ